MGAIAASGLPELVPIAVLSPYVTRVMGFNPSSFCLQGSNTYLVGAPDQNERVLIDTGVGKPEYLTSLRNYLEITGFRLAAVLLTHWHEDHIGGVKDLKKLYPNIPFYKYENVSRDYADTYTYIEDNQVLSLAGINLKTLFTPGHCEDHLSFWLNEEKVLFSGDHILGHGTTIFWSYGEYLDSLHRVKAIPDLGKIYPGHGQVVVDGPTIVDNYIAHRKQREQQLIDLLKSSDRPLSVREVAQDIYSHVSDTAVLRAASYSISQVLEKLEIEGVLAKPDQLVDKWTISTDSPSRL